MVELDSDFNRRYAGIAAVIFLAFAIGGVSQLTGNTQNAGSEPYTGDQLAHSGGAPAEMDRTANLEDSSGERKKTTRMDIELEVPDVEKAQTETQQMVEQEGGYVTSSRLSKDPGTTGRLEIKVPEQNRTDFISEVENSWTVKSRNVDTDDVTDRYTELELELENKRQELRRLEEMMNRTEEVDSLIKIQDRMSQIRSRIQYLENRLESLDKRVEYTSISISYEEPQPFHTEIEFSESFKDAYRAVFQSMNLLIVGMGYLLPFLLIGGIIYKGRNLWREFKRAE